MAANDIFRTALVKKPKRARFDFSHSNSLGLKIGYGIPSEVRFIVPGDEVSVSMQQVARLAPMPVPTFADLKVRHDWFFVPCRLMYNDADMSAIFGSAGASAKERVSMDFIDFYKVFSFSPGDTEYMSDAGDLAVPGSLFDYLGYPVIDDLNCPAEYVSTLRSIADNLTRNLVYNVGESSVKSPIYKGESDGVSDYQDLSLALIGENGGSESPTDARLLLEPLIAYHYIWRDWYRFTGIEASASGDDIAFNWLENHFLSSVANFDFSLYTPADSVFNAGVPTSYFNGSPTFSQLGRLFQVHATKDMFTSVRYGSKPTVLIPTGENANIPTLREASAIQRFIDLVSVVGSRYFDKIKALFNVHADGFADDRVQFLARYQQFIKIGEVLTTSTTDQASTGDYAGRGILIDGKYLFKRRFTEPGWLMCITSIIPDIAYKGLRRELTDTYYIDTPIPALAQIGDQSVLNREVNFSFGERGASGINNDASFGDQFRYYSYKSAVNEVHGSFRMESMRSWVPTLDYMPHFNVLGMSRFDPAYWNKFFNDMSDELIFGDRFYFKLDFSEFITRQLPKYINYHL